MRAALRDARRRLGRRGAQQLDARKPEAAVAVELRALDLP
jgi:hypothetical protein